MALQNSSTPPKERLSFDHLARPEFSTLHNRRPVHELIADSLRLTIMAGHYLPGERLNQEELATIYGVSRMPVREALLRLQGEELVVYIPRRGFAVAELSAEEVEDIFSIRTMLEGLATRLAIPNMTEKRFARIAENLERQKRYGDNIDKRLELNRKFHGTIYEAARRPRLVALITNLRNIVEAYSRIYTSAEGRAEATIGEHQLIFEACLKGDAELGECLAQEHLQNILAVLVPKLKSSQVTNITSQKPGAQAGSTFTEADLSLSHASLELGAEDSGPY